jgi:hypothetical protein
MDQSEIEGVRESQGERQTGREEDCEGQQRRTERQPLSTNQADGETKRKRDRSPET